MAVDAAGLGLWLFALNGFVFNRTLDQDDYSTIICLAVLCYAVCLQYGLRPGSPWWVWLLKTALGQALAAVILYYVFTHLGMDLSGRQVVTFFALHLPLHILVRLAYLGCRRALPTAPLECVRLTLAAGAGFFFWGTFATNGSVGTGDSYWYCIMTGDFVSQWRAGVFPVFVGQSEYAFNGAVSPLRFAPGLQHFAGVLDLLTGRSLPFYALQNCTLILSALGGLFSAYFCVAAILPQRRWSALALAVLYAGCPGVLSLGYQGDLFMSMTALPYVPLAIYGLWRTLQDDENTSIAWTVLPLAAVWYCHPPIALWLTGIAMAAHVTVGLRRWRDRRLYAWWGRGVVLFGLATGYLFISVRTLRISPIASDVDVILESIRGAFPGMLMPVSSGANQLSDYQFGWSLWGLLLLACACCVFRPRRAEVPLLVCAVAMLLLLVPVPWLNSAFWHILPATVRDITFHWPMQRFYVVLAAIAIIAAAGTLTKLEAKHRMWAGVSAGLLLAGVLWSFREGSKFVVRGYQITFPAAQAGIYLERHNIILTRYAFNPFPSVPPYYTHGYIDPYLENRVLAADRRTVLASNVTSARPPDSAAQIPLSATYDGERTAVLAPQFSIAPGTRYAVRVELHTAAKPGSLLIAGRDALREYIMPDSSGGMPHLVPTDTFGFGPTNRDFFPLWTSASRIDTLGIQYVYGQHPVQPVQADFARLYIQTYAVENLPVKITSWIPYRAKTTAAIAGAWLETPRLYIPGYAATVNGRPAPVSSTASGLVAVGLQAGENDVVLRYPGPWPLRASYWIALLTWAVSAVLIARAAIAASQPPAVHTSKGRSRPGLA